MKTHHGFCHCGSLQFDVTLDARAGGTMCNCSICTKLGGRDAIVNPGAFVVTKGEAEAGTYAWGSKVGVRYFCKQCGVHAYGRGTLEMLGGAYVSVNLNCLDEVEPMVPRTVKAPPRWPFRSARESGRRAPAGRPRVARTRWRKPELRAWGVATVRRHAIAP